MQAYMPTTTITINIYFDKGVVVLSMVFAVSMEREQLEENLIAFQVCLDGNNESELSAATMSRSCLAV